MSQDPEVLAARVQQLEEENAHIQNEAHQIQNEAQHMATEAYNRGYATRQGEENLKDVELKEKMTEGMESIKLELRMQSCSSHIRSFAGESSEKFQLWLQDLERNLVQLGNDNSRARALVLQTLTGPAADFATREIRKNPEITWAALKIKLDERYNDMADLAFARIKLRRMAQARAESVQNYFERLMVHARHAYGDLEMQDNFVQLQLVEIFVDGLLDDHMVRRLIRLKPTNLEAALRHATSEQQARKAFDLRRGPQTEHEPMEIGVLSTAPEQETLKDEVRDMKALLMQHMVDCKHRDIAPTPVVHQIDTQQYIPRDLQPAPNDRTPRNMGQGSYQAPYEPYQAPFEPQSPWQAQSYQTNGPRYFSKNA